MGTFCNCEHLINATNSCVLIRKALQDFTLLLARNFLSTFSKKNENKVKTHTIRTKIKLCNCTAAGQTNPSASARTEPSSEVKDWAYSDPENFVEYLRFFSKSRIIVLKGWIRIFEWSDLDQVNLYTDPKL